MINGWIDRWADGWMDGWIVELLEYACKSYLIYARIRLHKNVFWNGCMGKWINIKLGGQKDRLTIPSLASSSIFATGKFGFKLLGFKVSANTEPRLPLGTVSMAADAAAAASFFFLLS